MPAPTNKADAKPVFVHPSDPGWDMDRIEAEMAKMEAADPPEDPKQHPYVQHSSGATRYDLDAPFTVLGNVVCARDYLREDTTLWTFRRLSWDEWDEVEAERTRAARQGEPPLRAYSKALRYALMKVEGKDVPDIDGIGRYLTHDGMQTLDDLGRSGEQRFDSLRRLLGMAAYNASVPLTNQEKKA